MISYQQLSELNRVISEISTLYTQKVNSIVYQTPDNEEPVWKSSDLKELRKIHEQLKLLNRIRDNCIKVLEDLELLKDTYCLLN